MPAKARVQAEMRLGEVLVAPATVLAPMAGVTDTVFRRFIRHASLFAATTGSEVAQSGSAIDAAVTNTQSGCGLLMTEFTSADGLARMRETKRQRYLTFYDDEHPIGAQLFGANPETLAEAARIVEETGFDLVDLNLGCPAKRVVGSNGGSGLLRDLPRIGEIFRAVRKAVTIPFTVKFRMGWNDNDIVCLELARMAEAEGLNGVGAARPHPRAGLQRPGALGVDRQGQAGGEDSGHRQRRHSHSGGRGGHGGPNRLRCGDDRPGRAVESLDLPPDCAVHGHRQL
jgi:tRNA-dihydrouridine synthase B